MKNKVSNLFLSGILALGGCGADVVRTDIFGKEIVLHEKFTEPHSLMEIVNMQTGAGLLLFENYSQRLMRELNLKPNDNYARTRKVLEQPEQRMYWIYPQLSDLNLNNANHILNVFYGPMAFGRKLKEQESEPTEIWAYTKPEDVYTLYFRKQRLQKVLRWNHPEWERIMRNR